MNAMLPQTFFLRDVLEVAPDLLGKKLVRKYQNGEMSRHLITEVEAYRGEEDLACHASKGKTQRTQVMYQPGGVMYVYLIYGIHYMLNFVTAAQDNPQAVLIRGIDDIRGPGRVAKHLLIDKALNGQSLCDGENIWLEPGEADVSYTTDVRVGVHYAGNYWKNRPWRFIRQ